MKKKIQHSVLAISLLALVLATVSLPVHAQPTVNTRTDKSAYAPGDSGTMTISIINTIGNPLLIRNITIYYPWAGYDTNGKWFTANYTYPVSPPVALATKGTNNYSYTTPSFNIPSWWGGSSTQQFPCPRSTSSKFGLYSACILPKSLWAPCWARSSVRTVASALYHLVESRRSRVQIPPGPPETIRDHSLSSCLRSDAR